MKRSRCARGVPALVASLALLAWGVAAIRAGGAGGAAEAAVLVGSGVDEAVSVGDAV